MKLLPATIGFGDLLRRILVFEKMRPLTEIAAALGITVRNFCTRLRNGVRFDPDDISILLRMIDDERLRAWLFAGSGLLLVRQPATTSDGNCMTLVQRTASCAVEAMSAIYGLADAVELSMLAAPQIAAIEGHLDRAQSGMASIKLHLQPPRVDCGAANERTSREAFIHLVRRVLLTDRGTRPSELAAALGLSGSALHARMTGRVGFVAAELRQMLRLFPDPQLGDYLLTGTLHTAILRPTAIDSHTDRSPTRTGLQSLREVIAFLQALLSSQDSSESALRAAVVQHLDEAVRQMATLRWNMTHIGHNDAPRTLVVTFQALKAQALKAQPLKAQLLRAMSEGALEAARRLPNPAPAPVGIGD
jgi:hypothetical protein